MTNSVAPSCVTTCKTSCVNRVVWSFAHCEMSWSIVTTPELLRTSTAKRAEEEPAEDRHRERDREQEAGGDSGIRAVDEKRRNPRCVDDLVLDRMRARDSPTRGDAGSTDGHRSTITAMASPATAGIRRRGRSTTGVPGEQRSGASWVYLSIGVPETSGTATVERPRVAGSGERAATWRATRSIGAAVSGDVTSREKRADSPLEDGAQRGVVFALACVLALDAADRTALGALAPALKVQFSIGNGEIGLLASAFSIVGGLATIPMGVLTDRTRRITLLVVSIAIWSVAMGVAAAATTFAILFAARIVLGVVTAAGGPPVTSMVGDLFSADVRGRVLGWVKSGEVVGAGAGFLVAGALMPFFSWRSVFVVLGACGVVLAFRISRIEEPPRGLDEQSDGEASDDSTQLHDLIEDADVEPKEELVLHGDQADLPITSAMNYVLHVRTLVMIIAATAFGEFFFAALQVFGVLFLVEQFDISASTASLLIVAVGAAGFVGVVGGGRLGDRLIRNGVITGRIHDRNVELSRGCAALRAGAPRELARGGIAVPRPRRGVPHGSGRAARGRPDRRREPATPRAGRERSHARAGRRTGGGPIAVRAAVGDARGWRRRRSPRCLLRVPTLVGGELFAPRRGIAPVPQ